MLTDLNNELLDLREIFNGNESKRQVGEKTSPTINSRLWFAVSGTGKTYGPTETHIQSLELASKQLTDVKNDLKVITDQKYLKSNNCWLTQVLHGWKICPFLNKIVLFEKGVHGFP